MKGTDEIMLFCKKSISCPRLWEELGRSIQNSLEENSAVIVSRPLGGVAI
jgi:hypothetical protein